MGEKTVIDDKGKRRWQAEIRELFPERNDIFLYRTGRALIRKRFCTSEKAFQAGEKPPSFI